MPDNVVELPVSLPSRRAPSRRGRESVRRWNQAVLRALRGDHGAWTTVALMVAEGVPDVFSKPNRRLALKILECRADARDFEAMFVLAQLLEGGTKADKSRAEVLLRRVWRASRLGLAANNLGCAARDRGDAKQAALWFRRAIAAGEVESAVPLARLTLAQSRVGAARHREVVNALRRLLSADAEVTPHGREEAKKLLRSFDALSRRS